MKLTFVKKLHEVGKIYSYFFTSDELTEWQAGQYINLTMPGVPPSVADRLFTITSVPHEQFIQITTVVGPSLFKQRLHALKIGDTIEADQLGGDFTYDSVTAAKAGIQTKRLFIAGGIGITPFISIIRDNLHKKIPLQATLLYAGKNDRRAFVGELAEAAKKDSSLRLQQYVSKRLTVEEIKRQVPDVSERIIYLAGSQDFVEGLGEGLMKLGIPRSQIKYDWFDGYTDKGY